MINGFNKAFVQQLMFFVFGLQFLIAGIIWGNMQMIAFSAINMIIMIWLFSGSHEEGGLIYRISHLFKHYLFVLSGITLVAGLIITFFAPQISVNLELITIFFAIGCCIIAKDLVKGEIYFGNKLIFPKDIVFWGSLVLGFIIFQGLGALHASFKLLLASIGGFIVYIIMIKMMKLIKHVQLFKLKTTLTYSAIIILSTIWSIVTIISFNATVITNSTSQWRSFAGEQFNQQLTKLQNSVIQNVQTLKIPSIKLPDINLPTIGESSSDTGTTINLSSGEALSGYGEVLKSLDETPAPSITQTGSSSTGTQASTGTLGTTGNSQSTGTKVVTNPLLGKKNLTYAQVLPYLMEANNIPLSSKKTISFSSVSRTNALYPVFVTAYEKRMIGTATKPTTVVSCQTYMVLKGIAEGWNVSKRPQASVFDRYRAEAEEQKKLNGCTRNAFVNGENL